MIFPGWVDKRTLAKAESGEEKEGIGEGSRQRVQGSWCGKPDGSTVAIPADQRLDLGLL